MAMNNRLMRPRQTGFDPRSIVGLSAWWDFADSSSITLNGGNISQILDKSGAGRTASQATASAQPALTSNALNGRSMVTFNGSSRFLTYATDLFTFTGAASVFVVCRDIVAAQDDYAAFLHEHRGTRTSVHLSPYTYAAGQNRGVRPSIDSWSGLIWETASDYGATTQTTPAIVQYHWTNWSTVHNNGNTLIGYNNDSVALTNRGSSPLTFSTAASRREIGAGTGGGAVNNASVMDGRVGEILVWTVALSATQRSAVRLYLSRKWGITVT